MHTDYVFTTLRNIYLSIHLAEIVAPAGAFVIGPAFSDALALQGFLRFDAFESVARRDTLSANQTNHHV